jgi:hypothetical protein
MSFDGRSGSCKREILSFPEMSQSLEGTIIRSRWRLVPISSYFR